MGGIKIFWMQKFVDAGLVCPCQLVELAGGLVDPRVNSYYPHPRWIARLHDGFQFEFQTLFPLALIHLDHEDMIIE